VCNHVSFVDAVLLMAASPRPIRFIMDHRIFAIPVLGWMFRLAKAIPIAPQKEDPKTYEAAFAQARQVLAEGDLLCIFPEGGITRDGELAEFKGGIMKILETHPVPVVPLALQNLWGSFFSRVEQGNAMVRPFRRGLFSRSAWWPGRPWPRRQVTPQRCCARRWRGCWRRESSAAAARRIVKSGRDLRSKSCMNVQYSGGSPSPCSLRPSRCRGCPAASPPCFVHQPALQPGLPAPKQLHPALWRAHQVGQQTRCWCTPAALPLDAELPGGGWPARVLTELLLPHPGVGELRLLAPVLAAVQQQRSVMLFDPPAALCGWALAALGLDLRSWCRAAGACRAVSAGRAGPGPRAAPAADVLWALEQALKSGHVGAVLAWLPARLRADALRRLQLAAQAHDGPAFLLREARRAAGPARRRCACCWPRPVPTSCALRMLKRAGRHWRSRCCWRWRRCCRHRQRARARAAALPAGVAWASAPARPRPGPVLLSIHEPDGLAAPVMPMLWLACSPAAVARGLMPPRCRPEQREQPVALLADHRIAAVNAAAADAGVKPG
jgi:1-acyl-sn-glycerol-3-phosphate acyltransferase